MPSRHEPYQERNMRLQITSFQAIGGNLYTVLPLEDGFPTELAELGGSKVVEVDDELGKKILRRQAESVDLQCRLALVHSGHNKSLTL